jgi:PAS domain S-box-containing protein
MPWSAPVRAPDLSELETLVVCAAEGSMASAAQRLGISRPGVAKRIRNLEALAGCELLHRGGRGVRLTEAGAALQASAQRMLAERDVLAGVLTEIRGEESSAIAGLRELLGSSSAAARASQLPEARLRETEHVLELVLRASATGVVISDPETSTIHEVNDAFCRFTGRSREELLSQPATELSARYDGGGRSQLIEEIRRVGVAERIVVRLAGPDGSVRFGEVTARFVSVAGSTQLLSTVDDVTEQHRLDSELASALAAYRAVTRAATLILAGSSVLDALESVIPELRRSGEFATALLWCGVAEAPSFIDGDPLSPQLEQGLQRQHLGAGGAVRRLRLSSGEGTSLGWIARAEEGERSIVLLDGSSAAGSHRQAFADVLADLLTLTRERLPI